jgi:hypothetical protein
LIIPLEVKKRRCRYVIYKRIDASSYYGYMNDEDDILEKFKWLCRGGDARKSTEEVVEDRVHALNYEWHRRVTYVFSSAKKNLSKTLIVEVCICTLSIKLFLNAFLRNNHSGVISIALVCYK